MSNDRVEKSETGGGSGSRPRRYQTPRLSRVPLRPQEAVLGNCKTSGVSGPASAADCAPLAVSCSSQGS